MPHLGAPLDEETTDGPSVMFDLSQDEEQTLTTEEVEKTMEELEELAELDELEKPAELEEAEIPDERPVRADDQQ